MSLARSVGFGVGAVGTAVALVTGYLIVRGPFLGGPTLSPRPLLVALAAFLVGVAVGAWGATTYARAR
ncbi:MAG: hypothetical protein ABEJ82_09180 [Haloplanus sp.]